MGTEPMDARVRRWTVEALEHHPDLIALAVRQRAKWEGWLECELADVCEKSKYQLVQPSGLDPTSVHRLFDGEKRGSNMTMIRLTIALVMDPKLAQAHPARVPFILNALKDAQLSDAIAELN